MGRMYPSHLPDTPYFRSLRRVAYKSPLEFNEVLNSRDQVDFTRPTAKRNCVVPFRNVRFYVDLKKIAKVSKHFAKFLETDCDKIIGSVKPENFEILLRHICPSISGIYMESLSPKTIYPILCLALAFNLKKVIKNCREFICSKGIKQISVEDLLNLYDMIEGRKEVDVEEKDEKVTYPMRRSVMKALLEHENQTEFNYQLHMLEGSEVPCFSAIKYAMKRMNELRHPDSFSKTTSPQKCNFCLSKNQGKRLFQKINLAKNNAELICSSCKLCCCSSCRNDLCPGEINRLLVEHEKRQKIVSSQIQPPPGMLTPPQMLPFCPAPPLQSICHSYPTFLQPSAPIPTYSSAQCNVVAYQLPSNNYFQTYPRFVNYPNRYF